MSLWLYHLRGVYLEHQETIGIWDKTFMTLFMMGALVCLLLSGSYHMMCCHSQPVSILSAMHSLFDATRSIPFFTDLTMLGSLH
jgi:hypothetical protein